MIDQPRLARLEVEADQWGADIADNQPLGLGLGEELNDAFQRESLEAVLTYSGLKPVSHFALAVWLVGLVPAFSFLVLMLAAPIAAVLVGFCLWVVGLSVFFSVSRRSERQRQEVINRLVALTYEAAQLNYSRKLQTTHRKQTKALSSKNDSVAPFPRPQALPLGVSHRGAEELCAQWMRYFGQVDATTTAYVADGGIDVMSSDFIAQVKNYSGSVGVAPIREILGVSMVDGRKPLFFTSGTYASGAIEFANKSDVALFMYEAESGSLRGANKLAKTMMRGAF